jgi:hypothetical protein
MWELQMVVMAGFGLGWEIIFYDYKITSKRTNTRLQELQLL